MTNENDNQEEKEVGLQCLSDGALAQIVEAELENNGELKSVEAYAALAELNRRTPE